MRGGFKPVGNLGGKVHSIRMNVSHDRFGTSHLAGKDPKGGKRECHKLVKLREDSILYGAVY
jgi:hypothetical protein